MYWWIPWKVLKISRKKWYSSVESVLYLEFRTLQIAFLSLITLQVRVALNSQYLFVVDAKPFLSKWKCRILMFLLCFRNIIQLFSCNVFSRHLQLLTSLYVWPVLIPSWWGLNDSQWGAITTDSFMSDWWNLSYKIYAPSPMPHLS